MARMHTLGVEAPPVTWWLVNTMDASTFYLVINYQYMFNYLVINDEYMFNYLVINDVCICLNNQ